MPSIFQEKNSTEPDPTLHHLMKRKSSLNEDSSLPVDLGASEAKHEPEILQHQPPISCQKKEMAIQKVTKQEQGRADFSEGQAFLPRAKPSQLSDFCSYH